MPWKIFLLEAQSRRDFEQGKRNSNIIFLQKPSLELLPDRVRQHVRTLEVGPSHVLPYHIARHVPQYDKKKAKGGIIPMHVLCREMLRALEELPGADIEIIFDCKTYLDNRNLTLRQFAVQKACTHFAVCEGSGFAWNAQKNALEYGSDRYSARALLDSPEKDLLVVQDKSTRAYGLLLRIQQPIPAGAPDIWDSVQSDDRYGNATVALKKPQYRTRFFEYYTNPDPCVPLPCSAPWRVPFCFWSGAWLTRACAE